MNPRIQNLYKIPIIHFFKKITKNEFLLFTKETIRSDSINSSIL